MDPNLPPGIQQGAPTNPAAQPAAQPESPLPQLPTPTDVLADPLAGLPGTGEGDDGVPARV
ncbi:hypothetical protein KBX53_00220 [Micromonospora sp. M51]|uniref:hypothetical protein n=1 Tax=Micromonospora sp. M51 TaxID=2824889 RepID=UPI001B3771E7|nr:hypothetical protein [Micromonospora sp. M51]MBQ1009405.1 hypothetical protein [Micromonospora sp. M51]